MQDEAEKLRQRVKELESILGQRDKVLAHKFGLPPRMSDLLGLLLAVEVVTPRMIRDQLSIAAEAKIAIHRLRAYMEPFNVKIHVRRGVGYWLDDDTKEWVRGVITQEVTNAEPSENTGAPEGISQTEAA